MQQAFADLRALQAKADDMVKLAQKVKRARGDDAQHADQDGGEQLNSALLSIGIAPITK